MYCLTVSNHIIILCLILISYFIQVLMWRNIKSKTLFVMAAPFNRIEMLYLSWAWCHIHFSLWKLTTKTAVCCLWQRRASSWWLNLRQVFLDIHKQKFNIWSRLRFFNLIWPKLGDMISVFVQLKQCFSHNPFFCVEHPHNHDSYAKHKDHVIWLGAQRQLYILCSVTHNRCVFAWFLLLNELCGNFLTAVLRSGMKLEPH